MTYAKSTPHPIDIYVGAAIRRSRMACGLSQGALGAALGVSFQQIQKYERGRNRCAPSRLALIARACGVGLVSLFPDEHQDMTEVPELNDDVLRTAFSLHRLEPMEYSAIRTVVMALLKPAPLDA